MLIMPGFVFLVYGLLILVISLLMWKIEKQSGEPDGGPVFMMGLSTGIAACGAILLLLYKLTGG